MLKRAKIEQKPSKKKESLPPIHCKGCKATFVPKDRRQHFHSPTCREKYYERVYHGKTATRKTCPNCGSEFITNKPGRQDYCHPDCRKEAAKKREEGLAASVRAEKATFYGNRFSTLQRDDFKCTYCGKGAVDGVKLDVEEDGKGGLRTVCNLCAEGRRFSGDNKTHE